MYHGLIFSLVILHSSTCFGLFFSSSSDSLNTEKISKLSSQWDSIRQSFLDQYHEDRDNHQGVVDASLSGFTKGFRQILDSEREVFPVEDINPQYKVYLCANYGKVSDMKTIRKVDKNEYVWNPDGSIDVAVYYDFEDFKISYGKFYFQTPVKTVTGNITLSFKVNRIKVEVRLLSLPDAVRALVDRTVEAGCLVSVRNFQWEKLDQIGATVHSDSALDVMGSLSALVTSLIARYHDMMVKTMEKQVLMELYNQLPKKPLCKHADLITKATEYEANKKREFSNDFQSRCGAPWVVHRSLSMLNMKRTFSRILPF